MDEQVNKMVGPYHGISFTNKKEWSSDTGYNVDEHDAHCKEARRKRLHILLSIYMKCPA